MTEPELTPDEPKEKASWGTIPWLIKGFIIREMDITTRTNLKMTSKRDYKTVESVPCHFNVVKAISDDKHWPPYTRYTIDNLFIESKNDHVIVHRNNKVRYLKCENDVVAYKVGLSFFNSIVFVGRVTMDFMRLTLHYPEDAPFTHGTLVNVKELEIAYQSGEKIYKWLDHFVHVEDVTIMESDAFVKLECGVRRHSVMMNAKSVCITQCEGSYAGLKYLRAQRLGIGFFKFDKTEIKKMVKRWIDEDYPINSKMCTDMPPSTTLMQYVEHMTKYKKFEIRDKKVDYILLEMKSKERKCMALYVDDGKLYIEVRSAY